MCLSQTKEDVTRAMQWAGDYDPDYASWLPPSGMYISISICLYLIGTYVHICCIINGLMGRHICMHIQFQ